MRSLEDWIKHLLTHSVNDLNSKYSDYHRAETEVYSLPGIDTQKRASSHVPVNILEELHQKLQGQVCEANIWNPILCRLCHPLPPRIAHDLIDRDIDVLTLGHTRQEDEVQWRLASLVDEALLTLFWDLYTNPAYDVAELNKLLNAHRHHRWLLDKWQYWASSSSSPEKEIAFHLWTWKHPHRTAEPPNPQQYPEIMAARKRQEKESQLQAEREETEARLRVEREAEERRLELAHVAKDLLNEDEIRFLLAVREPEMLLALAGNPQIPIQWIQKLINCHHIKGARAIREAVQRNVEARQSSVE